MCGAFAACSKVKPRQLKCFSRRGPRIKNGRRRNLPGVVLYSYSLLGFLYQEKGYKEIGALLEKALENGQPLLICFVNWAEIRYVVERKSGAAAWEENRPKILSLPIEI